MRKRIFLLALASLALVGGATEPTTVTTTTTTQEVTKGAPPREGIGTRPPPAVRVESQTVAPGPGYVWTRGYWRWSGSDYMWVPGSYVVRPRPAAMWVDGRWVARSGGWVWIPGNLQ